MSLGKNSSFFHHYGKSSYVSKVNPEFQGIAKKYYDEKREHQKVHVAKSNLNKEVAYIQRMEKHIQNVLQKRKKQLQFTKEVNNRILNDIRRREWVQESHRNYVRKNQQKAQLLKIQSEKKLKQAKFFMLEHKQSLASINKEEKKKVKQSKTIKRAKQWDTNRSRVSQIYQFEKSVKENTNNFFKARNSASLSNLQNRIKTFKNYQETDQQKIKELEHLKKRLSEKIQREKTECDELSKEIVRVKKESQLQTSLVRSRSKYLSESSHSSRSNYVIKHQCNSQSLHSDHI